MPEKEKTHKIKLETSSNIFCPKCGAMGVPVQKTTLDDKLGEISKEHLIDIAASTPLRYCKFCDIYYEITKKSESYDTKRHDKIMQNL